MNSDRRTLLRATALAAGLGLTGLATGSCTEETQQQLEELLEQIANRPVRKDIATLQPNDPVLISYGNAITAMKQLPQSDGRNWTRQAQIHESRCRHQGWLFFPWHRAYLYYFEEICREVSGDMAFALPYWNWTQNPQLPPAFTDSASPLFHVNRVAGASSTANPNSVGQPTIDNLLNQSNFISFAGQSQPLNSTAQFGPGAGGMEAGPHNYIHNFIGGTMVTFLSPLDPIFWMHHNRIDELWVEWNIISENPNTSNGDWTGTEFNEFFDKDGNPAKVSVLDTVLYPFFSYRFDTQV